MEDVAGEEEVAGGEAIGAKAVAGARNAPAKDKGKATASTLRRAIANSGMTASWRIYHRKASKNTSARQKPESARRDNRVRNETISILLYP